MTPWELESVIDTPLVKLSRHEGTRRSTQSSNREVFASALSREVRSTVRGSTRNSPPQSLIATALDASRDPRAVQVVLTAAEAGEGHVGPEF